MSFRCTLELHSLIINEAQKVLSREFTVNVFSEEKYWQLLLVLKFYFYLNTNLFSLYDFSKSLFDKNLARKVTIHLLQ